MLDAALGVGPRAHMRLGWAPVQRTAESGDAWVPGEAKPYEFMGVRGPGCPQTLCIYRVRGHGCPQPYEFIGFGAMDVTNPHKFIGFGAMNIPGEAL